MQLDSRQTATILAALRFWQRSKGLQNEAEFRIATNDHTLAPLGSEEIDALCEQINAPQTIPTAVIEVNGGIISCSRANVPMRVVVLDEDLENSDEADHRQIFELTYYVHDAVMTELADPGQDGIDRDFVQRIVSQL